MFFDTITYWIWQVSLLLSIFIFLYSLSVSMLNKRGLFVFLFVLCWYEYFIMIFWWCSYAIMYSCAYFIVFFLGPIFIVLYLFILIIINAYNWIFIQGVCAIFHVSYSLLLIDAPILRYFYIFLNLYMDAMSNALSFINFSQLALFIFLCLLFNYLNNDHTNKVRHSIFFNFLSFINSNIYAWSHINIYEYLNEEYENITFYIFIRFFFFDVYVIVLLHMFAIFFLIIYLYLFNFIALSFIVLDIIFCTCLHIINNFFKFKSKLFIINDFLNANLGAYLKKTYIGFLFYVVYCIFILFVYLFNLYLLIVWFFSMLASYFIVYLLCPFLKRIILLFVDLLWYYLSLPIIVISLLQSPARFFIKVCYIIFTYIKYILLFFCGIIRSIFSLFYYYCIVYPFLIIYDYLYLHSLTDFEDSLYDKMVRFYYIAKAAIISFFVKYDNFELNFYKKFMFIIYFSTNFMFRFIIGIATKLYLCLEFIGVTLQHYIELYFRELHINLLYILLLILNSYNYKNPLLKSLLLFFYRRGYVYFSLIKIKLKHIIIRFFFNISFPILDFIKSFSLLKYVEYLLVSLIFYVAFIICSYDPDLSYILLLFIEDCKELTSSLLNFFFLVDKKYKDIGYGKR